MAINIIEEIINYISNNNYCLYDFYHFFKNWNYLNNSNELNRKLTE